MTRPISASGLSMFRNCPMSFYYKYIAGFKPLGVQDTEQLQMGKIFHSILEGEPIDYGLDRKTQLSIEASADYIRNRYVIQSIGSTIAEVSDNTITEYQLENDGFTGFIDLVVQDDDGDTLIDYKYVASLDYAEGYKIGDQTKLYPYLYTNQTGRPVKQMVFLCVVKPTIRLRREETEEEYFERIQEWYGDFTCRVKEVVINREELDELAQELADDLLYIRHMIDNAMFYRNNGSCNKYGQNCQFYPICYKEKDWNMLYIKREDDE